MTSETLEASFLRGDLRMKSHLEEKIAQLFDEFLVVATFESVQHLVGLFDEIRPQRVMGLLAVPWTAAGIAQTLLNRNELLKPVARRELIRMGIFSGSMTFPVCFRELFVRGHVPSVESIECSKPPS